MAAEDIAQNRFEGGQAQAYLEAHKKLGLTIDSRRAIPCKPNDTFARDTVVAALKEKTDLFDALIVHSAHKALGTSKAIEQLGLRTPRNIGLAMIGDTEFGDIMEITTWTQPVDKICKGLVSILKNRLDNTNPSIYKLSYESNLIVRNSTNRQ